MTLAEMFARTRDLAQGYDRVAVAAWAEPYGTDVARAVRECHDYGVLTALAFELGQGLVAAPFEHREWDAIPEMRGAGGVQPAMTSGPTPEKLVALTEELRSKLDVDLMQRALDARPHDETVEELEERVIAGALADEESLRDKSKRTWERLWGPVGFSVSRKLRREAAERYAALRAPLRQLRRGRRA